MAYPSTKKKYLRDDVERHLPYRMIAEVTGGELWARPYRKREWNNRFTEGERDNLRNTVIPNARRWAKEGPPERVYLTEVGESLWRRLTELCIWLRERAAAEESFDAALRREETPGVRRPIQF